MIDIFTIGYGNRTIDSFLNLISEYGINILIDVRTNPFSRYQSAYNKSRLKIALLGCGINYIYMGNSLGGKPKDQSLYKDGRLNYSAVNENLLYKAAVSDLILLSENKTVCLMCCELDPENCHRKNLIAVSLSKLNVGVLHIDRRGIITPHNNFPKLDLF